MPHTRSRIPKRTQNAVDHWMGILWASGRVLVLEKCFWYAIDFMWQNGIWHYLSIALYSATLTIPDDNRQKVEIPRLETLEARRMLGVHIAPNGNNEAEAEYLTQIAKE